MYKVRSINDQSPNSFLDNSSGVLGIYFVKLSHLLLATVIRRQIGERMGFQLRTMIGWVAIIHLCWLLLLLLGCENRSSHIVAHNCC